MYAIDLSRYRPDTDIDRFFSVAQDLLCIFDGRGIFRRLSQSWESTLGYSLQDLKSLSLMELVHPDDQAATAIISAKLAEGSSVSGFVNRLRCPDGSHRYMEWQITPVGPLNFGSVRDISLKLAHEAELIAAKEATELASHAKNQFLAHMSHQLYTPLNAIVGLGHLLGRTPLDSDQAAYLEKLGGAAHQLLALVNDLLDFSQLETGQLNVEHEEFVLEEVIQTAFDQAGAKVRDKDLNLRLDMAPDLPRTLLGDSRRLHQILNNLLDNAIRFTPSGHVELTVRHAARQTCPRVEFSVSDTGTGIEPDFIPELFKPFVPDHKRLTASKDGTGLGLVICRKLLAMMGGEITVESMPDQGSTFSFYLPVLDPTRPEIPSGCQDRETSLEIPPGKRALLVEDNDINRLIACETLRQLGITVTSASSGPQAINMVEKEHFDLIFMDILMPGMDGYTAASIIRHSPAGSGIPIIALTAFSSENDREKSRQAGMVAHLGKPINQEELKRTIIAVLSGTKAEPSPIAPRSAGYYQRDTALSRLGGNSKLLDELLDLFLEENSTIAATLRRIIAAADYEEARRIAHNLKGSASNLALDGIARLARQLETELGPAMGQSDSPAGTYLPGGELESRISILETAMTTLNAEIRRNRPGPGASTKVQTPTPAPAELPAAELSARLTMLDQLLADRNYLADTRAHEIRSHLESDSRLTVHSTRFYSHIANLDYPAARRVLAQIRQTLET